jgi:hypothetical protein
MIVHGGKVMAMNKIKKSDVIKVTAGIGIGVAGILATEKLVVPAVKKRVAAKKAAKATVDVNINKNVSDDK